MDYFMESLVSDISPNASPRQARSPIKGSRRHSIKMGHDVVDESSVDIYGDMMEESFAKGSTQHDTGDSTQLGPGGSAQLGPGGLGCHTKGSTQLSPGSSAQHGSRGATQLSPEGSAQHDAQKSTKQDIDSSVQHAKDSGQQDTSKSTEQDTGGSVQHETAELKARIKELDIHNNELELENKKLSTAKIQLTKNISCLFLTSRNEIQRKDKEIEELRNTIKDLKSKPLHNTQPCHKDTQTAKQMLPRSHNERQSLWSNQPSQKEHPSSSKQLDSKYHRSGIESSHRNRSHSDRAQRPSSGKKHNPYIEPLRRDRSHSPNTVESREHSSHRRNNSDRRSRDHREAVGDSGKLRDRSCDLRQVMRDSRKSKDKSYNPNRESRVEREFERRRDNAGKSSPVTFRSESDKEDGRRDSPASNSSHRQYTKHSTTKIISKSEDESFMQSGDLKDIELISKGNELNSKHSKSSIKDNKLSSEDVESALKDTKSVSKKSNSTLREDSRKNVDTEDKKLEKNVEMKNDAYSSTATDNNYSSCPVGSGNNSMTRSSLDAVVTDTNFLQSGIRSNAKTLKSCVKEIKQIDDGEKLIRKEEEMDLDMRSEEKNSDENMHDVSGSGKESVVFQSKLNPLTSEKSCDRKSAKEKCNSLSERKTPENEEEKTDSLAQATFPKDSIPPTSTSDDSKGKTDADSAPSQNNPEKIVLTSFVDSNQEWDNPSPLTISVPFSGVISPESSIPKQDAGNTNTNSEMLTNQTWPFENRGTSNVYGESSVSGIENPGMSIRKIDPENLVSKSTESIRAFPISDLDGGIKAPSDQSSDRSDSGDEKRDVGKLDSNSSELIESTAIVSEATEETNSGSGCSGSRGSSSSKSTESILSSLSTSSSSSSRNTVVSKETLFLSPIKPGFLWTGNSLQQEDNTKLTSPKPKHVSQSTPIKLSTVDIDANNLTPSKSDNIMCTPNLIVLGDEEATCATLNSPFKSNSVPSELIPPGVRKEIKEINTHFRHIRGKPEFLHDSSPSTSGSPVAKSKSVSDLLTSNSESPKSSFRRKRISKKDVPAVGLFTSKLEKSTNDGGMDVAKDVDSNGLVNKMINDVVGESDDAFPSVESVMQPIVNKAFKKVFRKDLSLFKKEMAVKSKNNFKILAPRLKHSARLVKSLTSVAECKKSAVECVPSTSSGGGGDDKRETEDQKEMEKDLEMGKGVKESLDIPGPSNEIEENQKSFVNEWVWYTSFNVKKPQQAKSTPKTNQSKSLSNDTEAKEDDESLTGELSFKGIIPSTLGGESNKALHQSEGQSLCKLRPNSDDMDNETPVSNSPSSCKVTSSSIHITEQEVQSEECNPSQLNVHHNNVEGLISPEPDSTSDPVIGRLNSHESNDFGNKPECTRVQTDSGSYSPDSPTKGLGTVHKLRKSPRKRSLKLKSCNSPHEMTLSDCDVTNASCTQVESDLYLSSENNDSDEEALNSTFIISKNQHENEFDSENLKLDKSVSDLNGVVGKLGGKTPIGGWDEMSLMECNSLSEFDRDVTMEQLQQVRATKGYSRTASFSSHISVGGISPFSVSSPKLSTPSHARSPRDLLWSPLNRTSDSQDSCNNDVRTPVRSGGDESEEIFVLDTMQLPNTNDITHVAGMQLSRLLSLQDLQRLRLIKTNFGSEVTSSNSSSDNASGSDLNDGNGQTSVKNKTPVKDQQSPVKKKTPGKCRMKDQTPIKRKETPVRHKNMADQTLVKHKISSPYPNMSPLLDQSAESGESKTQTLKRHENCETEFEKSVVSRTDLFTVCRRSPRKKVQVQRSPKSTEKIMRREQIRGGSDKEKDASFLSRSPKKKRQLECSGEISDWEDVNEVLGDDQGKDVMSNNSVYMYSSPQRSVRIVEENSSGENILIGSCSKENNVLLKRICISDTELVKRSPVAKNSGCVRDAFNKKRGDGLSKEDVDSTREGSVDNEKRVYEMDKEVGGQSGDIARRPLSLQENNNIDQALISTRNEFVRNVKKVTRRLELEKEQNERYNLSNSQEKVEHMRASVNHQNEKLDVSNLESKKGKNKDENIEKMEESCDTKCANDKEMGVVNDDGNGDINKNSDDNDDMEDGEILDSDEEQNENDHPNLDNSCQSKNVKDHHSVADNTPENNCLHITQEGCKAIPSPKARTRTMSARHGKNFARKKDTSRHGISPMARIYTPPSSSTSKMDKSCKSKERPCGKRLRSSSPLTPDRKRLKAETKDGISRSQIRGAENDTQRHSDSNSNGRNSDRGSRRHPHHSLVRRRSPEYKESRKRCPVLTKHRHKSSDHDCNQHHRLPARNQRPPSPIAQSSRRISPRKRARELTKFHRDERQRDRGRYSGNECRNRHGEGRLSLDSVRHDRDTSRKKSNYSRDSLKSNERNLCRDRHDKHHSDMSSERSRSCSRGSSHSSSSQGNHRHHRKQEEVKSFNRKDSSDLCKSKRGGQKVANFSTRSQQSKSSSSNHHEKQDLGDDIT